MKGYKSYTKGKQVKSVQNQDPDLQGSFAESWVLKPDGGAIGYVGATRTAFAGGYGEGGSDAAMGYMDVAFFQSLAAGQNVAGLTWAQAQWAFVTHVGYYDTIDFITLLQCVLLGDPAARVGGLPQLPRFAVVQLEMDDSVGGDGQTGRRRDGNSGLGRWSVFWA